MAEKILEIQHLKKSYGQNEVLKIDGAKEGWFSATRAPDDGDHLSFFNRKGNIFQDFILTIRFF